MKMKLFYVVLIMTLWVGICMAQPNNLQDQPNEVAKWGNAVQGVQLSVGFATRKLRECALYRHIHQTIENTV
jgi:hypothetical protein